MKNLVFCCCSVIIFAVFCVVNGKSDGRDAPSTRDGSFCGENVRWSLINGALFINGTGDMMNYSSSDHVPWLAGSGILNIERIVIREGVTSIGDYAFYKCSRVKEVILSSTVLSIGDFALFGCTGLAGIIIPAGVEYISGSAFDQCSLLASIVVEDNNTHIKMMDGVLFNHECDKLILYPTANRANAYTIPDGVTAIGDFAFSSSSKLNRVTIPASVTSIGRSAFRSCSGLSSIDVDPNNQKFKSIDGVLFNYECDTLLQYPASKGGDTFIVPDYVRTIRENAFFKCAMLRNITILHGLQYISDYSFSECYNLIAITIPDTVVSIGSHAFDTCVNLPSLIIPNSVAYIGDSAFRICQNLQTITLSHTITSVGDYAFYACQKLMNITIPENVTSIGDSAFYGCPALESINMSHHLTSIGNCSFCGCSSLKSIFLPASLTTLGNDAFQSCSQLNSIDVDEENQIFKSIDGVLFIREHNGTCLIRYPPSRINSSYVIPNNVTSIGDYAFSGCKIKSIIVSDGVRTIGNYAFSECGDLSNITLPLSVLSFGNHSFEYCKSLTIVTIPESMNSVGDYTFYSCDKLTTVFISDGVTSIGDHAFYGCRKLRNFTIPKSMKSIGAYAFSYCNNLTDVVIPGNVESIGAYAFANCAGIVNVTIPSGMKTIEEGVFSNCKYLTNVFIPEGVQTIMHRAFSSCSSLEEVIIPDTLTTIADYAFSLCNITTITIPSSVVYVGDSAFHACASLSSIDVDESNPNYKSIDGVLFNHDTTVLLQYPSGKKDSSYTIPLGVISIDRNAFQRSIYLTSMNAEKGHAYFSSIEGVLFNRDGTTLVQYPSGKTDCSYVIPYNVRKIESLAFSYNQFLENVTIPDSVKSIGGSVFHESGRITSLFYQGVDPIAGCSIIGINTLKSFCVAPGYKGTSFCGKKLTSELPECQDFRSKFDPCYAGACVDRAVIQVKKGSVIEWEGHSNECFEYFCDNTTGNKARAICNSSNETGFLCLDDKCVGTSFSLNDQTLIEIELEEGVNIAEIDSSQFIKIFGQDVLLKVGYEIDTLGSVARVLVFVDDPTVADSFADTFSACIGYHKSESTSETSCNSSFQSNETFSEQ